MMYIKFKFVYTFTSLRCTHEIDDECISAFFGGALFSGVVHCWCQSLDDDVGGTSDGTHDGTVCKSRRG